jgi:hypothetical protein
VTPARPAGNSQGGTFGTSGSLTLRLPHEECLARHSSDRRNFRDDGVPQDYTEAAEWYRKAAEQGFARGQNALGFIYIHGRGVPQNYAEALTWYRKAADQGLAEAQQDLGVMYAKGNGVPQDYVMAHMWFNLAAARLPASAKDTRELAVKNRDLAASKMTAPQIAEAQRLARNDIVYDRLAPGVLEQLKKVNPKDEAGRRKRKHFQWLTTNIGYPKLREHLGAVVAIMKLSNDWHDFRAKLNKLHPPIGKPTQLSLEFAEEGPDTGKGL